MASDVSQDNPYDNDLTEGSVLAPLVVEIEECGFNYRAEFGQTTSLSSNRHPMGPSTPRYIDGDTASIVHPEPLPPYTWNKSLFFSTEGLTMPGYTDDMPLFTRAEAWENSTRCFETPVGAHLLTEKQAYDLYIDIAQKTTGVMPDTRDGVRTVLGIRGAYPGTFEWHGNAPNQFNDTLVLLWMDSGNARVREFPVNTDTGAVYFGADSSSSLRANRRYTYINGWHRSYNAPQMYEWSYRVANDSNGNGHWDRDRNGWLGSGPDDYERKGGAHNIHMASVNGPLGKALIQNWSAGCQVIPGAANWTEFLGHYWTQSNEQTDYFLVDARDIDPRVWSECTPDGSHTCPFPINEFPFNDSGDTRVDGFQQYDTYNCSDADESGPETVYYFTVDRKGTLSVTVDALDGADIDIHLLDGDDPNACLERHHTDFEYNLTPGRYFIIADTWADEINIFSGSFELTVDFN